MRGMLGLCLILLWGASAPAVAQDNGSPPSSRGAGWGIIDGIGYGGLGFGVAVAATWDMESDHFGPPVTALMIIGASTVAGTVLGAVMGSRAQRTVAAGRPLDGAHRVAVIAGGVMAGGTLGALTSAALIQGEGEGTVLGSDEQTFTILVLVGTALSSLYVWRHREELTSGGIGLAPEVHGSGKYGLRVRVTY